MKRIVFILLLVLSFLCNSQNNVDFKSKLEGKWQQVSVYLLSGDTKSSDTLSRAEVFIEYMADGTFKETWPYNNPKSEYLFGKWKFADDSLEIFHYDYHTVPLNKEPDLLKYAHRCRIMSEITDTLVVTRKMEGCILRITYKRIKGKQ
jgi:hypothetical protein